MKVYRILALVLCLIVLIGCASTSSTPTAASTATPTPATPTPAGTPTESIVLVSSPEPLIGTWHCPTLGYIRFDTDGVLSQSEALSSIDKPFSRQQFWFEGSLMLIKEIYLMAGLPKCKTPGGYEVFLYENGDIRLRAVKDICGMRARDTAGRYSMVK